LIFPVLLANHEEVIAGGVQVALQQAGNLPESGLVKAIIILLVLVIVQPILEFVVIEEGLRG
jgi:hypothetical protein